MDEANQPKPRRGIEIALGVVHVLWGGLSGLVALTLLLASLSDQSTSPEWASLLGASFVAVTVGEVVLGFMLAFGRGPRARAVILLGVLAAAVLGVYASVLGLWALTPGVPLWLTLPWALRLPEGRALRAKIPKRYAVAVGLFAGALAFVGLFKGEIKGFLWDLKVDRWESRCNATGDVEACGWLGLDLMEDPANFDAMRKARAAFEKVCASGAQRGCEFVARITSDASYEWFYGWDHYLGRERQRIANEACEAGDARGCVVVTVLRAQVPSEARVYPIEPSQRLCEAGNAAACYAWQLASHGDQAAQARCAAGWGMNCAPELLPRCLRGDFAVCPREGDDADVHAALVELASVRRNPAFHMARPTVERLGERCDGGSSLACFALGLAATADVNPVTDAPATRSMESTFGRACDLGASVGCRVFALRLLDRPVTPPAADRSAARELFRKGCELGDEESCWYGALLAELPASLDEYRVAAERACRIGDANPEVLEFACVAYAHVLAHDLEAEPWLTLDSEAYVRHRESCRQHRYARSCVEAARLVLERGAVATPSVLPLMVEGANLAEIACKARRQEGCQLLFEYAADMKRYGMASPAELRGVICEQDPKMCESNW